MFVLLVLVKVVSCDGGLLLSLLLLFPLAGWLNEWSHIVFFVSGGCCFLHDGFVTVMVVPRLCSGQLRCDLYGDAFLALRLLILLPYCVIFLWCVVFVRLAVVFLWLLIALLR